MKRGFYGLVVLLTTWAGSGAQTFVLHGLTNVTIGNAVYGQRPEGVVFHNLGSNGTDGVSIHLGEADSGLWVYPTTTDNPDPGDSMTGKVYGTVAGVPNQLICRMRAWEEVDGVHPVEIDFSPLGATNFTYIGYDRGLLVGTSTGQVGSIVVGGDWFDPLSPRVNPFWRFADGSVGAVIEFLNFDAYTSWEPEAANISVPGLPYRIERLFIKPEGVTNIVNFASRLDIFGGDGLRWFNVYDARLGMFGRGHKALEGTLLQARGGRLTLAGTNDTPGVAIELQRAGKFDAAFTPIELGTNTSVVLSGIGRSVNSGDTIGYVHATHAGDVLNVSAHLVVGGHTDVRVVVLRSGIEVARASGTNASVPATTRIIGAGLQARERATSPYMAYRFDQSIPVVLPNQTSVDGDEVRFVASDDGRLVFLETMVLEATVLGSFTIIAETEQPAERPTLGIRRDGSEIELFWTDPNGAYQVEAGWSVLGPYYPLILKESGITYDGDMVRQKATDEWNDPGERRFFRLTSDPRRVPPPEQ